MTSDPTSPSPQPLTGQPMRPDGRCSLAGPSGSRIPIEEPHSYSARKGANTIFVRTCDLCGDIDWDALHEATVERVAIEVHRLRAELDESRRDAGAEHGRAAALEAAYREACTARDVRDTEIERLRAENTAQVAAFAAVAEMHQMQQHVSRGRECVGCFTCGTDGPCPTRRALGLDQDGEGNA